jgi:hypothetical protein
VVLRSKKFRFPGVQTTPLARTLLFMSLPAGIWMCGRSRKTTMGMVPLQVQGIQSYLFFVRRQNPVSEYLRIRCQNTCVCTGGYQRNEKARFISTLT